MSNEEEKVNTEEKTNENNIIKEKNKKATTNKSTTSKRKIKCRNIIQDAKDSHIKYLQNYIKNFLFRKKVKILIKKQKDNYILVSTINDKGSILKVYSSNDETKEYDLIYEPILKQNLVYIPRKDCKKNLLKCHFVNSKGESIVDPKFNTSFEEGLFLNVINLKKMREKEEEREEDFQTFLEHYFTGGKLSKECEEFFLSISSQNLMKVQRNSKKNRTVTEGRSEFGKLKNKIKADFNINSILKQRPSKRIPSGRRISFGEVKFSY